MQLRGSTYHNVGQAFRSVYRTEGLSAFYVSYPTTLMMTVPFTAVQFTTYEYLKDTINPSGSYSPGTHIIAGGAAGAVAAAISTPLDVLKTLFVPTRLIPFDLLLFPNATLPVFKIMFLKTTNSRNVGGRPNPKSERHL